MLKIFRKNIGSKIRLQHDSSNLLINIFIIASIISCLFFIFLTFFFIPKIKVSSKETFSSCVYSQSKILSSHVSHDIRFFTLIISLCLLPLYSHNLVLKSNLATYQTIDQTTQWFIMFKDSRINYYSNFLKWNLREKKHTSSSVNLFKYNNKNKDMK
jgi:hypothetical protein